MCALNSICSGSEIMGQEMWGDYLVIWIMCLLPVPLTKNCNILVFPETSAPKNLIIGEWSWTHVVISIPRILCHHQCTSAYRRHWPECSGCIQDSALRQIIIGGGYLVSSCGWRCVLVSERYPHVNMTTVSIFNRSHSLRSMAFPKTITQENLLWDPVSAFACSRQRYTVTSRTSSFCAAWTNFHCRDRVMVKFYDRGPYDAGHLICSR